MRWMNPTGRSGFALASGKAVMTVSGRGRSHEATLNTDVRDVTMQFDFSLDKATGGSGAKVMAVLRKSKAGSYRVRVRLGREGRVWLSVAKARGQSTSTIIGQPVLIKSWRYRAGQTVKVRAQAIKKDPTQLRVKAWPAGSAEPGAWQLVRNDTSADIGGTGRVGLRTMVTRRAINPTATVRFDDVTVNRAQDAEMVAVTPSTTRSRARQANRRAGCPQAHRHERARDPEDRYHGGHPDVGQGAVDAGRAVDRLREVRNNEGRTGSRPPLRRASTILRTSRS